MPARTEFTRDCRNRGLQSLAIIVALGMDRGDHQAHRYAYIDQSRFRQLRARFDRLGHRVGDTEFVKLAGVVRIAGTRDDGQVLVDLPRGGDDLARTLRGADRDDQRPRLLDAATGQEFRPRRIAPVDVDAALAELPDEAGVGFDREELIAWALSISPTNWPTRP